MLAEATTIQETKELKDLGLSAVEWARRKGLGKKVYQGAWGFALEAERKLGGLLAITDLAKGGEHYKKGKTTDARRASVQTLKELGLTGKESSAAQFLAKLPGKTFQAVKSFTMTLAQAKRDKKREEREERLARRESEAGWVAGRIETSRRREVLS